MSDRALLVLHEIVNARRRDIDVFRHDTDFANWAQGRARMVLAEAAPPREEVPTPKRWYQHEMPPTDEPLKRWIIEADYEALEERLADCRKMLEGEHDAHMECHTRADKAEARVSELEIALRACAEQLGVAGEKIAALRELAAEREKTR